MFTDRFLNFGKLLPIYKVEMELIEKIHIYEAVTGLHTVLRLVCGTHLLLLVFNAFSILFFSVE